MSNDASRFVRVCRKIKHLSYAFILGSVVTAYGAWDYASTALDHFDKVSFAGYCRERDVDGNLYWSQCIAARKIDGYVAGKVQQEEIEYDRAGLDVLVKKAGRK